MIGALLLAASLTVLQCGGGGDNPTGPSTTGPIVFSVQMSAANEVPPVTNAESGARGTATITFNVPRDSSGAVAGAGTATFSIQLSGFPRGTPQSPNAAIAAHIHPGAAGVAGPILVPVTGLGPTAPIVLGDGTANLTFTGIALQQDWATQIVANPAGYYFNVHTPSNTAGAVRGQLVRVQ
jgi:hypothetical protein